MPRKPAATMRPRQISRRGWRTAKTVLGCALLQVVYLPLAWISRPTDQLGAAEPALAPLVTTPAATGSASCLAVACHGRQTAIPGGNEAQQIVARAGRIWLQQDPHARAVDTIRGARYQDILARWAAADATGGRQRDRRAARCAACHDPQGLAIADPPDHQQGIGCESCHGSAQHWLARHYERDATVGELNGLGLRDLKQPSLRAAVCAGCHVGDANHDLNHDMLAAGHPPLRFEFAGDHARLPRHWRGETSQSASRAQEIHLWTAGQLAAAAAALERLASRADHARPASPTAVATPWPELSEYNCLSCHQRVRAKDQPAAAESVVRAADGAVAWSAWHYRLALPVAQRLATAPTSFDEQRQTLAALLARPRRDANELADLARRARELRSELVNLGQRLPRSGALRRSELSTVESPVQPGLGLTSRDVLELANQVVNPAADWESLCQATLALEAVRRAVRPDESALPATVNDWREVDQSLRRIRASLAFGERLTGAKREPFDWPRVGLPEASDAGIEPAWRDWPALLKAFDRPRDLLRSLDALQ